MHYTYLLNHPDTSSDKFYNVILKTYGNLEKVIMVTYSMDKEFASDYGLSGDLTKFTGTITLEMVTYEEGFPCDEEPEIPVPVAGGGGSGGGSSDGGDMGNGDPNGDDSGGNPYNQALVDAKFKSMQISAWSNPEYGQPWDGSWTEAGPGDYILMNPALADPSNPCGDAEETGIIEPQDKANCKELKKMMENAKIRSTLETLQSKTDKNREFGYSYSDAIDPVELQLKTGSENEILVNVGGQYYGASHLHPNQQTTSFAPMFSISDILILAKLKKRYVNTDLTLLPDSKFVFTLTFKNYNTPDTQTYALKIENWSEFSTFIDQYTAMTPDEQIKISKKLAQNYGNIDRAASDAGSKHLLTLLKYMKKINLNGIAIYKATDESLSEWEMQSLDSENKYIIAIPCN